MHKQENNVNHSLKNSNKIVKLILIGQKQNKRTFWELSIQQ